MTGLDRDQLGAVLAAAVENAPEPMVIISESGADDSEPRIAYANDAFVNLLGTTRETLLGAPLGDLGGGDSGERLTRVIAGGEPDCPIIDGLGGGAARLTLRPVDSEVGRYWHGAVGAAVEADYLGDVDPLTGRPSRRLFDDRLERTITAARRVNDEIAVIVLDIDRFDRVVAAHGRTIADAVLCGVALRLQFLLREVDDVTRFDDSRFALVLRLAQAHHAARLAQKIKEALDVPFLIKDQKVGVTPSIGISLFPDDADSADRLVRRALDAMERAKECGGDGFRFASERLHRAIQTRIKREIQMRWALEREQFRLFYQPMVNPGTGELTSIEALLRWQLPGSALVEPDDFLSVAEETGLIIAIGEWVLRAACLQIKAWIDQGIVKVPLSVNLSPPELRRPGLLAIVKATLAETKLEPRYLCLDLPMRAIRDDPDIGALIDKLRELKSLGLLLSIDHVGADGLPLRLLQRLPIDRLSLHRSLVRDESNEDDLRRIADATIALAHSLDLSVVVQGVESAAVHDLLRSCNIDAVQGYLLGKPLPPEEFARRFGAAKSG